MATIAERLKELHQRARAELQETQTLEQLEGLRIKYLGRRGELTQVLRQIGELPPGERPAAGQLANQVKEDLSSHLEARHAHLKSLVEEASLRAEALDVSLPGRRTARGTLHPLTRILDEITSVFLHLGFEIARGPEAEEDYYNFEALNIPAGHPARELQDSFYLEGSLLLRTHTSPVQIRTMERVQPPVRIIAPGRVYRRDTPDASHHHYFVQVEGLLVDEGVSLSDLKAVVREFVNQLFGPRVPMRFRPSYFPFVEPGAEVDIGCLFCDGAGCPICKGGGWLEIMGAGMVHPAVFRAVEYDTERYTGYAFGMGVDRVAFLKYGIPDLRIFYENDLRFLQQF